MPSESGRLGAAVILIQHVLKRLGDSQRTTVCLHTSFPLLGAKCAGFPCNFSSVQQFPLSEHAAVMMPPLKMARPPRMAHVVKLVAKWPKSLRTSVSDQLTC